MRAVLLGVVAGVAVIAAAIIVHGNGQDTIYTLAAIQTGRARHPQAWTGRRVLVRGRITIAYALQPTRGVIWWLPTDCAAVSACLAVTVRDDTVYITLAQTDNGTPASNST